MIAVPDEVWGERPLALVVPAPGAALDPDAIRAALADRHPRWWVPDRIEAVAELPKTSVGKLDKAQMRERYGSG